MDLLPILYDDYARDCNRDKYGEGGGHAQRKHEGEEGNSDQRLTKTES